MMRIRFSIVAALLLVALLPRAKAASFTSMYVFGDSVSTTTDSPQPASFFYGNRYCNGRVWVEVLAQRQGLTLPTNHNVSFFGHYSPLLVTNVNNFVAPADVATALFVVWIGNADLVGCDFEIAPPYIASDIPLWTNKLNVALSNYSAVIQTLFNKGARTIVAPNAADISIAPYYAGYSPSDKLFIRQRSLEFNARFAQKMNQSRDALPGLTLIVPDLFSVFEDVIAHPGTYGFTNVTGSATEELADTSFNGPGTNYMFWEYLNLTAKMQEILADKVQSVITPSRVASIAPVNGSNALSVASLPLGLAGFVDSSTNLLNWTPTQGFNSTNVNQTILVPASGPKQFYRLRFPYAWTWP